ncbi:MAG: hypothetical protein KDD90_07835 [Sphingomonadaceae bacterium]|jgi:uncharacterized protein HemX|nr:hypothetical protein [Sphingomonadaceae bacterium]
MTEERTTVTRTPDGDTHTSTTVYSSEPRRGGAGKWVFLILLALVLVGGLVAFNQMGGAEIAKDTAIADAANKVGDAAQQVGDAAEDVADDITSN